MYSFYHLSVAKDIMSSTVDRDGVTMFRPHEIMWAKQVISWFNSIYKAAKKMSGSWCIRIKIVWQTLKQKLADKHIIAKIKQVKTSTFGVSKQLRMKILFNSGVYGVFDCPVRAQSYWKDVPFKQLIHFIKIIK